MNNKCLVLLATYNGAYYVEEQLKSILNQKGVDVNVIVSDDSSTDNTLDIIKLFNDDRIAYLEPTERMGSAAKNFFRMIKNVKGIENYDYFAFADQDDIWIEDKLQTAVSYMNDNNVDGHSCNVLAFWEDGREVVIDKTGRSVSGDFYFGTAGPGCSYVLNKTLFLHLKKQIFAKKEILNKIDSHDWLIYAFARENKYKWHINKKVGLRYRQHSDNVFGANVGLKAAIMRWNLARSGWFRKQILLVGQFCEAENEIMNILSENDYFKRLNLVKNIFQYKRNIRESIFLGLIWLIPGFK